MRKPRKPKGLSQNDLLNIRIKAGIEGYESGTKSSTIAKILGVKLNQLKNVFIARKKD